MSGNKCHGSLFGKKEKLVDLVGGGSVINGPTPSSFNLYCFKQTSINK